MSDLNDFVLRFDNNVVEHLGLKLYQNQPTRVLAEVVSNAWDANAREVHINLNMQAESEQGGASGSDVDGVDGRGADNSERWISVIDNGRGMTHEELISSFLVIGRNKREPGATFGSARKPMGRKGIGKLAPFGISRIVDVVTAGLSSGQNVEITWLRINLDDILRQGARGAYSCAVVFSGADFDALPIEEEDQTGQVRRWVELVHQGRQELATGTIVLMKALSIKRSIPAQQLIESLGRRFTVTFNNNFDVYVNSEIVRHEGSLPAFDFRIPHGTGYIMDQLSDGRTVRYWAGFVGSAVWSQDAAGVGVYAHGKIAQDRPFTFGSKGNEIFTRYMYAVVEADWLDDLPDDLISTDRTSVNWDSEITRPLWAWGNAKVGEWSRQFQNWKKSVDKEETRKVLARGVPAIAKVSPDEVEGIIDLVGQISPRLGHDKDAKENLIRVVSDAWVQKPMQRMIVDLWGALGETDKIPASAFVDVVSKLVSLGVPESLNLAIVFAQRIFALNRLFGLVHNGGERDLQNLIADFPWIIEPDMAVLTADRPLKNVVLAAEKEGLTPFVRSSSVAGVPDINRPDFVFLSSPEKRDLLVVELKNPQKELTTENKIQLEQYLDYLSEHYPQSNVEGVLVGRNASKFQARSLRGNCRVVEWTDVLRKSIARHEQLLSAMLIRSGEGSAEDSRVESAIKLGGPELMGFLRRLAEQHAEIQALVERYDARSSSEKKS
jgi:hypothetical protein